MAFGRLIRVRKFRRDAEAVAYIVAVSDSVEAVELIKNKVAVPEHDIEDLGRVSDALVRALKLAPGDFVRADKAALA